METTSVVQAIEALLIPDPDGRDAADDGGTLSIVRTVVIEVEAFPATSTAVAVRPCGPSGTEAVFHMKA